VGRARDRGAHSRVRAGREAFDGGLAAPAKSVRKAFSWAAGLNWHLTRSVKQVVHFERTTYTGGAAEGGDRPAENVLFVRTQLAF